MVAAVALPATVKTQNMLPVTWCCSFMFEINFIPPLILTQWPVGEVRDQFAQHGESVQSMLEGKPVRSSCMALSVITQIIRLLFYFNHTLTSVCKISSPDGIIIFFFTNLDWNHHNHMSAMKWNIIYVTSKHMLTGVTQKVCAVLFSLLSCNFTISI